MIRFIKEILLGVFIVLVAGVTFHYLHLRRDGEVKDANHAEEIGEGIRNTVDFVTDTYDSVITSDEVNDAIQDFKDGYAKKDSI